MMKFSLSKSVVMGLLTGALVFTVPLNMAQASENYQTHVAVLENLTINELSDDKFLISNGKESYIVTLDQDLNPKSVQTLEATEYSRSVSSITAQDLDGRAICRAAMRVATQLHLRGWVAAIGLTASMGAVGATIAAIIYAGGTTGFLLWLRSKC
ncbi:hypothetical protein KJY78_00945 [Canibacter sp. lx-45]|uniref:hypothetical protein n=1 Tax=Canibacter zhuwentaonis TaxID=2837491 RepID=UPI001BDC175E|nr:hypothetical protein [Canibacter zhuwentaonis]MBT1034921.1 hypothetical protein [Canibacter zhuwentaonis]